MTPSRAATIAVVSWNTRELLVQCLRSLAPEVDAGRADVFVVDNGSSDGTPGAVREVAPWARLLEPGTNLGFGRAVNLVARESDSQWLACANADVALDPGALEALLAAGRDSRVGCVAPRLLLPDGSVQHSVYPFPTIPFAVAFNLGLYRLSRGLSDRLCLEGYWDSGRSRAVPWAIGAFLLLRRQAFDAVGGFDERRFMYAEDLDLGWRLHDAGWQTRYEPRATARHRAGASTAVAFGDGRVARFTRATYAVLLLRRGRTRASATAALNVFGATLRLAWMAPLAVVLRRWRAPVARTRMWLRAHVQGLRSLASSEPGADYAAGEPSR